jgi:hypothetical protein
VKILRNHNIDPQDGRKRARKLSESTSPRHRRDSTSKESSSPSTSASNKFDPKPIRANALKGIREALRLRITKAGDIEITNDNLDKVPLFIYIFLFAIFSKSTAPHN